jgi:hypothetical protein
LPFGGSQVALPGKAAPEVAPAVHKPSKRAGSILGADCVLVPDAIERSENEHVMYPMPGAPGFVHSTADRTGLVSQCSAEGVGHVLEAMQHGAAGPPSSVVWISLRNEVVTYIAGKPYALRDAKAPLQPKEQLDFLGASLLQTERELKANAEEEVAKECGRLALQAPGGLKASWASVALGTIHSPADVVEEAGRRAAGITGVVQTRFECLPLPSKRALKRQDVLSLLEILQSLSSTDAVVVSSQMGAPVTTMAAVAASMAQRLRASGGKRPKDLVMREPLPMTRQWNAPRRLLEEFAAVEKLVLALDEVYPVAVTGAGNERLGELAKLLCDDTVDRWEKPMHLRFRVMDLHQQGDTAAVNEALAQYLTMVAFAALLMEACGDKSKQEHETAVLDALDVVLTTLVTE